jgi:outer membrane lipoprotein SlyB
MKNHTFLKAGLAMAAAFALSACQNMPVASNAPNAGVTNPQAGNPGTYTQYGVVQSIDLVRVDSASSGVGIGTIAGAVVGGIIGHQVGSGNGNTAATVLGAAGGAYAGRELEKRNQPQIDAYKLTIRLRDGTYQTVTQTTNADIRVGDRVRIDNGVAQRY